MCIPPQDNSGQGPTAAQALRDVMLIQQHGFTNFDELKQFQQQNGPFGNNPQPASPQQGAAPARGAPPAPQPVATAAPTTARAPTPYTSNTDLAIQSLNARTLGGVSAGSGLNVPR